MPSRQRFVINGKTMPYSFSTEVLMRFMDEAELLEIYNRYGKYKKQVGVGVESRLYVPTEHDIAAYRDWCGGKMIKDIIVELGQDKTKVHRHFAIIGKMIARGEIK